MTRARGRLRAVSSRTVTPIDSGWRIAALPPDAAVAPSDLASVSWTDVSGAVVGTVAAALRQIGQWSFESPARRFDADDWWWRTTVQVPADDNAAEGETFLCLDGLATVADVWWNGQLVLSSENMFVAHRVRVTALPENELLIRCRALDRALAARRPRPRWRAPMIENQQLRWFRTTLLGRTPGWSPPAAAVGPWRGARLEHDRGANVDGVKLHATVAQRSGHLYISCEASDNAFEIDVEISREGTSHRARLRTNNATTTTGRTIFSGELSVPEVALWWPHTHGTPHLYDVRLVCTRAGDISTVSIVDLGRVGFRTIALDTEGDRFTLTVNGVSVFCRGACWTPIDPVALTSDRDALSKAITQAATAGMNMLRVGGTMVYESDDFYDLCDERGVLLWHDFMFANMDYPEDAAFTASVHTEVAQFLSRLQGRPSLAVLCGSSEGEQQAAMWGAPRERWSPPLFHQVLPALVSEHLPDVPYWPSSAHGGAFPHQASVGSTSYYGVGAYLRPLEDARRSEVKFASECLAFANVPESTGMPGDANAAIRVHHPAWKARTPRDLGAGWDFDDVRDHYLSTVFRVDPLALRYANHDRYLALGRAVTGEVMSAVFGEWRRQRSTCAGGLIWFLRDLWPGAGWGVVDAAGFPKAVWWYLRRALAPVAAHISDEGGNGLVVHVTNDRPTPWTGQLELALYRGGEVLAGRAQQSIEVPAHAAREFPAAALFEGFVDLSYAYRFGPPTAELLVATLTSVDGARVEAFHFPLGLPNACDFDLGLVAEAREHQSDDVSLHLRTRRFAQSVTVDAPGFTPEDAWFHMAPGSERVLRLRRTSGQSGSAFRGTVQALNCETPTKIILTA